MKKINLLPWREQQSKLKIRQFLTVWLGVSCSCFILLFIAKILILQQVKHYQLTYDSILLQIKTLSPTVQEVKKLQFAVKELQKIIKTIQTNHQQVKKILDFVRHLNFLITPDIFVRLIEFHSPYLRLIMHANSEIEYLAFIKFLQLKYDPRLQWWILNRTHGLDLDFMVQMTLDEN